MIIIAKKREVVERIWDEGSDVWVHVDPRRPGVVVPEHLRGDSRLVLQVGVDMRPTPIPDLAIDDVSLRGTLTFGRVPFHVTLPWTAVYVIANKAGDGVLYRDALPPEVDEELRQARADVAAEEAKPGLRLVKS